MWAVWLGLKYLEWNFTHFVVTDDRVIYRTGVLSKRGVEIPMERINNINFHQGLFERFIGAGDLDIESAGRDGQSHFDDVWHPDGVQQELYRQMEANAKKRASWGHPPAVPMAPAAPAAPAAASIPEQLHQLAELRDRGVITARRVRDEEGGAARAHVKRRCRVVSLVPSATETLVALGVVPVGCTRFCELDGVPTVGGTKNVDVDALVALAPDLVVVNDEENRIEDARRARSARTRVALDVAAFGRRRRARGVRARALRSAPTRSLPSTRGTAGSTAPASPPRTRAFIPIWRRPWMSLAADTYGSSLLAHVGIDNVFGDADERYPEVALREVAARRRMSSCCPSEPYAFAERHAVELRESVAGVRTTFVDGRDLFWWGIRTPAAATSPAAGRMMASVRVRIDDLERGDLPALSVKTGAACANPVAIVLRPEQRPWSPRGPKIPAIVPLEAARARTRRSLTRDQLGDSRVGCGRAGRRDHRGRCGRVGWRPCSRSSPTSRCSSSATCAGSVPVPPSTTARSC